MVDELRHHMASAPAAGIVGALEAMLHRQDSRDLLPGIDVPTLVIAGEEDAFVPIEEARALQSAISGSRFESLAGAGHLSNLERPAAFNHVTGEFLGAILCTT
jgi:pimeloyl-ACP methyl ester carboxylesterase